MDNRNTLGGEKETDTNNLLLDYSSLSRMLYKALANMECGCLWSEAYEKYHQKVFEEVDQDDYETSWSYYLARMEYVKKHPYKSANPDNDASYDCPRCVGLDHYLAYIGDEATFVLVRENFLEKKHDNTLGSIDDNAKPFDFEDEGEF